MITLPDNGQTKNLLSHLSCYFFSVHPLIPHTVHEHILQILSSQDIPKRSTAVQSPTPLIQATITVASLIYLTSFSPVSASQTSPLWCTARGLFQQRKPHQATLHKHFRSFPCHTEQNAKTASQQGTTSSNHFPLLSFLFISFHSSTPHPSINPDIHPFLHPDIYPSIQIFIHLSIHISNHSTSTCSFNKPNFLVFRKLKLAISFTWNTFSHRGFSQEGKFLFITQGSVHTLLPLITPLPSYSKFTSYSSIPIRTQHTTLFLHSISHYLKIKYIYYCSPSSR